MHPAVHSYDLPAGKVLRGRRCVMVLLVLNSLMLTGCGGDSNSMIPVSGVVRIDGQPAVKGAVRFVPDRARGNNFTQEPVGQIGPDGKFSLTSLGQSGAPAGWYLVAVVSEDTPDSTNPVPVKRYVAARFNNPAESKLAVEVVANPAPGRYDLAVTAK